MSLKRFLIQTIIFSILCGMISGGIASAGDYSIVFWYVQKRIYENGNDPNRTAFSILDSSGNFVQINPLKAVSLFDPTGEEVTLTNQKFVTIKRLYGGYDDGSGQFTYNNVFEDESWFEAVVQNDLIIGNYHLVIIDSDDVRYDAYQYFYGHVDLPIISSKSFYGLEDESGGLLLHWKPPKDLTFWLSGLDTSIRVVLEFYKNGLHAGELFYKLPTFASTLFVPSHVMQKIKAEGDSFALRLRLRDKNSNNRTYSNLLPLEKLPKSTRRVVVIPMN